MTTQSEFVISCWGGIRPTARRLGEFPNTVQQWKKKGVIPSDKHPKVLEAAQADGLPITPDTLIYPPDGSNKTDAQ